MSKPVLYTFSMSIWSAVTDIARVELQLTDKVDTKVINVLEAENTSPEFIKISPNATLPALVADGKTYGSTIESLDYLVKISDVKVAPATELTSTIHEDALDPNFMFLAVRDDEELAAKAAGFQRILVATRLAKMQAYAASPEGAPHKALYDARIAGHTGVLALYDGAAPAEAKAGFFAASKANYDAARTFVLTTLPAALSKGTGPFLAGTEPGVDDFHVAGWLFHLALCAGARTADEGLDKMHAWLGAEVPREVQALWHAWTPRAGWKSTYPDGALH